MSVVVGLERGMAWHGLLTVALFLDRGRPHLGYVEGEPQVIVSNNLLGIAKKRSSGSVF